MALKSLQIMNFRALEEFSVASLGRVNLIVGKNNSGKSTVLEALRLYAGRGNLTLLADIAKQHDEKIDVMEDGKGVDFDVFPFESFFTNRKFPDDNSCISIGEVESNENTIEISHEYFFESEEQIKDDDGDIVTKIKREKVSKNDLNLNPYNSHGLLIKRADRARYIAIESQYIRNRIQRSLRFGSVDSSDQIPCSFVPTQFLSINELGDLWDKILFTPQEDFVKTALQIISPDFENLAFVKSETRSGQSISSRRDEISRIAKVKLKSLKHPIPLNSMGDGMIRVLQLILKAFPAKGGLMLIDEFENGLHYSVQVKIWKLLFSIAKEFDIQIFASTHSWDCIESFCSVATDDCDQKAVLFRVGKSVRAGDEGKIISTIYEGDRLANISQSELEVR